MRTNTSKKKVTERTHEGAPAARMTVEQALRRSVLSCLLWEREFYEDGQTIASRIEELGAKVKPEVLAGLAVEARSKFHLRHVPLLLLKVLAKTGAKKPLLVANTICNTIQRADELAEFVSLYWTPKKQPLSAQVKKGLALAFQKFSEHQLAKYDREGAVRLRDVLFLVHAKPKDKKQAAVWKRLAKRELKTPDTWEVALSGGADKKATFTRLLRERDLGYFALLRNLRNMAQSGVDPDLVRDAILRRENGADKVLPFRFIAAARAAPQFEPALDEALAASIDALPVLDGKTVVLVDVSGSMDARLSAKSDMTRVDAGAALAALVHGDVRMFSFSDELVEVPPRRGMAGVDAIVKSQTHNGTRLIEAVQKLVRTVQFDRLIVITDEQAFSTAHDDRLPSVEHGYMVNVASAKNGVGYGAWTHIDGFSEAIFTYIAEHERD